MVVPIVMLVWVSLLGRPRLLAGKPADLRQLRRFFANQTYLKLVGDDAAHTATLMAVTGVLGYCIAYFLAMKVRSPGWRLALFLAFIIPFWTSDADPRASPGCRSSGVNGVINQALMALGAGRHADRGVPLFPHRHHHGAGLALHA